MLPLLLLAISGCSAEAPAPSVRRSALATERVRISVGEQVDFELASATVVFRAGWDLVGKRDEGSRPGPMSLALAPDGALLLLDQVNRRVLDLGNERGRRSIPVPAETTEEIAVHGDAIWALLYEPGAGPGYRVVRLGEGGLSVPLDRRIQLVTGLQLSGPASAPSVWVEERHELQTLVVADGKPVAITAQGVRAPGRIDRSRPGDRLEAERVDRHTARVTRRSGPGWSKRSEALVVTSSTPLLAIEALETDEHGGLFLGILLGEEAPAPSFELRRVRKRVVVFRGGRALVVELAPGMATDAFRTIAVGPDGALFQLQTTEAGVVVRRWETREGGSR